jgi:ankyrin repeat protein
VNELLALGRWPDKPDSQGMTPLTAAAMQGDRANAELLLKAGADSGRALNVARQRGDEAMIQLLERYSATSKRP